MSAMTAVHEGRRGLFGLEKHTEDEAESGGMSSPHSSTMSLVDSNGDQARASEPGPAAALSRPDAKDSSNSGAGASQTSINIFRQFLKKNPDGSLDASRITSTECYKTWLGVRKTPPVGPEIAFKRALCGHITAVDGRVPFDKEEEEAILLVLRIRARWDCFKDTEFKFGESGFRAKGFHEKAAAGEALKSNPKKRAKTALQKLNELGLESGASSRKRRMNRRENDSDDEEDEDSDDDGQNVETKDEEDDQPKWRAKRVGPRSSIAHQGERAVRDFHYPPVDEAVVNPAQGYVEPTFSMSSLTKTLIAGMHTTAIVFTKLGMTWLSGMYAAARLLLLSRGWFASATPEQVSQAMERLNAQFPGFSITLMDFAVTDPTQRIVSQNRKSVDLFGPISQEFGGFTGRRFVSEESWHVFSLLAEVTTKNNEQELYSRVKFYVKGEPTLCHIWISVDQRTHLLVERLRVVEPHEL